MVDDAVECCDGANLNQVALPCPLVHYDDDVLLVSAHIQPKWGTIYLEYTSSVKYSTGNLVFSFEHSSY
jgi:hypothetical protein